MDLRLSYLHRQKLKNHDELRKLLLKNVPSLSKSKQSPGNNSYLSIHPMCCSRYSLRHNNEHEFREHGLHLQHRLQYSSGFYINGTFVYRTFEHNDTDFIDCLD